MTLCQQNHLNTKRNPVVVKKHFKIILLTTVAKEIHTSYCNGRFQVMEFASMFVYISYIQATLIIHI